MNNVRNLRRNNFRRAASMARYMADRRRPLVWSMRGETYAEREARHAAAAERLHRLVWGD